MLKDLSIALRSLRKNPVFTIAAILTIALGVGVSTAIFSVANTVLLQPLPYKDSERLVVAFGEFKKRNITEWPFSSANFLDLKQRARASFEDFGGVFTLRFVVRNEDGTSEQVRGAIVTPNLFRMLGARIALGRDFVDSDGEARPPSSGQRSQAVAVLSHEFWQRRYGANPEVLGNRTASGAQIVGILSPEFELAFPPSLNVERNPDIWTAARLDYDAAQRSNVSLRVVGKLKNGASLESAQHEVESVARSIRGVDGNHEAAGFHIRVEPMHWYLVAAVRPTVLALIGAATFLLLIACANVANLLLVRVSSRERELAVRAALGGSRWHLVRQTLTEALLLSGLGALVGVGLASIGIRYLMANVPSGLPRLESIPLDATVLGFTALLGLIAAILFGAAPAFRASRADVIGFLRAGGRGVALGSGRRLSSGVIIVEVALSFALLVGSGLMVRSFSVLQRVDPGFDSTGVLTFLLLGGENGRTPEQRAASMLAIQQRLRALPEVRNVTAATPFPLAGGFGTIRWGTAEVLADPTRFQAAEPQSVLPGYFETLRTQLRDGRTFTEFDNSPSRNVVVIDEILAAKAFPRDSAVGKRLLVRLRTVQPEWVEVIGVVAHQRTSSLANIGREQIFFTDGFQGHGVAVRWAVQSRGDLTKLASAIRLELARENTSLLVAEMQPMEALVKRTQARTRFSMLLLGVFGLSSLLLAGMGLFGVLSTMVRQRTAELGIRAALGATPISLLRLVVGHGLRLSAAGIMIGYALAAGFARLLSTQLVSIEPTDPATFATVTILFFLIATLASFIPARSASSISASEALRSE